MDHRADHGDDVPVPQARLQWAGAVARQGAGGADGSRCTRVLTSSLTSRMRTLCALSLPRDRWSMNSSRRVSGPARGAEMTWSRPNSPSGACTREGRSEPPQQLAGLSRGGVGWGGAPGSSPGGAGRPCRPSQGTRCCSAALGCWARCRRTTPGAGCCFGGAPGCSGCCARSRPLPACPHPCSHQGGGGAAASQQGPPGPTSDDRCYSPVAEGGGIAEGDANLAGWQVEVGSC